MDLIELRSQIDHIDHQLVDLFCQRMDVSAQIADYKKKNALPVYVPEREEQKLIEVSCMAGDELSGYGRILYSLLFDLSRSYQHKRNNRITPLSNLIRSSIKNTPMNLPLDPVVACVGAECEIACTNIFNAPKITYFNDSDSLFESIKNDSCQYGVVSIENSGKLSLSELYDLIARHHFSIVRVFECKSERNKRSRYICISKNLEIYPGSNESSFVVTLSHESGSLYRLLGKLFVLGINISKLESKSVDKKDSEITFYLDLEVSIDSAEFMLLICELDEVCKEINYLGSYREVTE